MTLLFHINVTLLGRSAVAKYLPELSRIALERMARRGSMGIKFHDKMLRKRGAAGVDLANFSRRPT